jgi:hypothetical protein
VSKGYSLPVKSKGRNKIEDQKKTEQAWHTHKLSSAEGGKSQAKETKQSSGTHSLSSVGEGTSQDTKQIRQAGGTDRLLVSERVRSGTPIETEKARRTHKLLSTQGIKNQGAENK